MEPTLRDLNARLEEPPRERVSQPVAIGEPDESRESFVTMDAERSPNRSIGAHDEPSLGNDGFRGVTPARERMLQNIYSSERFRRKRALGEQVSGNIGILDETQAGSQGSDALDRIPGDISSNETSGGISGTTSGSSRVRERYLSSLKAQRTYHRRKAQAMGKTRTNDDNHRDDQHIEPTATITSDINNDYTPRGPGVKPLTVGQTIDTDSGPQRADLSPTSRNQSHIATVPFEPPCINIEFMPPRRTDTRFAEGEGESFASNPSIQSQDRWIQDQFSSRTRRRDVSGVVQDTAYNHPSQQMIGGPIDIRLQRSNWGPTPVQAVVTEKSPIRNATAMNPKLLNKETWVDGGMEDAKLTRSYYEGHYPLSSPSPSQPVANTSPKRFYWIRLLKWMAPERGGTEIDRAEKTVEYAVETFPANDHPRFIALSYVWGDEDAVDSILINNDQIRIRPNLSIALARLRESEPDAYLWADAICINQNDEAEKSTLVQHMGEIFESAEKVYAWLGPADSDEPAGQGTYASPQNALSSSLLLDHLHDLGVLFWKHASEHGRGGLNERSFDLEAILETCLPQIIPRFSKDPADGGFPTTAYVAFSNRAYWRRIWVLQEVYLARDLSFLCGSRQLPSRILAGALILLETFQKNIITARADPASLVENPKYLRDFAIAIPSFPEMHRLIIYTSIYPADVISLRIAMTNFCVKELPRGSRATDPRDMIFGLLGFATPAEREYVQVDYGRTVQQTYTAATRAMIANGWTDILAWSQPCLKAIPGLPTWVPDFSASIYESLCSQSAAKPWLPQFHACGLLPPPESSAHVSLRDAEPDDGHLLLCGMRIDTVATVGENWYPRVPLAAPPEDVDNSDPAIRAINVEAMHARSASYADMLAFLEEVRELCRIGAEKRSAMGVDGAGLSGSAHHPHDPRGSIWRVPCADQIVHDSKLVRSDPSTEDRYRMTIRGLEQCVRGEADDLPAESRPYVEALLRWVHKRPFVTTKGFIGLGPGGYYGTARPGDVVAVLSGFCAPYILREVDEGQSRDDTKRYKRYTVVGEAYIDGVMDGEAVAGPYDLETIVLV